MLSISDSGQLALGIILLFWGGMILLAFILFIHPGKQGRQKRKSTKLFKV